MGTSSDEVNRVARLLIAEWERVEGPVSASYVANFADMARVVIADREPAAPDEPRATLREDERAQLRLTCFNAVHNGGPEGVYELVERIIADHVAEQLAPVVAAACAETLREAAHAEYEREGATMLVERLLERAADCEAGS